jgi:integrase
VHLTDQKVRALPRPAAGQKEYADDTVSGLCVVVGKSAKTFRLVTGVGNERKRYTLGRYDPPRFTLAMAREKARDLIATERLRKTELPRITFKEAVALYERSHLPRLRPSSARNVRYALTQPFAKLGGMQLGDIKRTDIAPLLDTMLDRPPTMLCAFRFLRAFLNWCVERGYIEHAPTDRMKPPKSPPSRDRVLSTEELVAIWHACTDDDYGRIVKLLILSGQRRDQWGSLRREYLQGDAILWPAKAMKMGKPHILPLTAAMKALVPERIGLIFSNVHGIRFTNWARCKERLDAESDVKEWRLHDLRRTWATIAADELDIQPHIIESVLAHTTGTQVARIYNRARYIEPMRKALLAFEEWLHIQLSKPEEPHGRHLSTGAHTGIHHRTT